VSNCIVVSFSIISKDIISLSHLEQHVIDIANCDKNCTKLEMSLTPLFDEINELNCSQRLTVADTILKEIRNATSLTQNTFRDSRSCVFNLFHDIICT
jgi:hypothetical protein